MKPYPREKKQDITRRVLSGEITVYQAAIEAGRKVDTIYKWVHELKQGPIETSFHHCPRRHIFLSRGEAETLLTLIAEGETALTLEQRGCLLAVEERLLAIADELTEIAKNNRGIV